MKNLVLVIISTLLSLAMILPGATVVMADSEKEVVPQQVARPALTMKAPDKGEIGQPVTITVFNRYNHQPVAGAEVYALKTNSMASTADDKNYTTSTANYAASVDAQGIFLGVTNSEGIVTCKFTTTGRYIVVAFKASHFPAFAYIAITGSNAKGLTIKAPGSAETGEQVTLIVVDRNSHEPVANVAIYGRKIATPVMQKPKALNIFDTIINVFKTSNKAQTTDAKIAKTEPVEIAEEVQSTEEVQKKGSLLGYTNDNGELVTTFDETGLHVLAAILDDYAPGFARISINLSSQKALVIRAPQRAEVNKPVTITVFERGSTNVVENAGVYALRLGDLITPVAVPAEKPTTLINTPQPIVLDASINAETVKEKGIFLGNTNNQGQVIPTFDTTGRYALAAVKDDYRPGLARITIVLAGQKALLMKVPGEAITGSSVPIYVRDRANGEAVAQAKLYALKLDELDETTGAILKIDPSTADTAAKEKFTAVVTARGAYIGSTDNNGLLNHTFNAAGQYLLVAIKDGYIPDFARIQIKLKIAIPNKIDRVMPTTSNKAK